MLCHSVRSHHSPLLSLYRSLVARLNLAIAIPPWVNLTSGSFPRFPINMTLFRLFGILLLRITGAAEFRFQTQRLLRRRPSNLVFCSHYKAIPPLLLTSVVGSSLGTLSAGAS